MHNLLFKFLECSVTTEPTSPMSYMFVLPDLVAPFKLNFAVRTIDSGIIALATGRTEEDIFCHISKYTLK